MIRHTVQKGDSLWKIAKMHDVSLEALIAANPQLTDPNVIMVGSIINVPEMWGHHPSTPSQDDTRPGITYSDSTGARPCIYEARANETLEQISRQFMVPLTQLLYYNMRYGKREPLVAGSRVIIPDDLGPYPDLPGHIHDRRYRR